MKQILIYEFDRGMSKYKIKSMLSEMITKIPTLRTFLKSEKALGHTINQGYTQIESILSNVPIYHVVFDIDKINAMPLFNIVITPDVNYLEFYRLYHKWLRYKSKQTQLKNKQLHEKATKVKNKEAAKAYLKRKG